MASDHVSDHVFILHDPVLQALVIALIFVLLGLTAHATNLILQAYWDHFVEVLYFDSKY
jgi:multisubunit Na+/H+ antiporter MnhC subunit